MVIDSQARYSKTHEWVRKEGDLVVYGITDRAQSDLSDIVYLELPEVGTDFKKGDVIGVIESVKAASDLILPVGGTVVEVNEGLNQTPEVINSDPYQAGWILKVTPGNADELNELMTPEDYSAYAGE
jgi:glycine cleavage system H protein